MSDDDDAWRGEGSWVPRARSSRWPPFVLAMLPCGFGAYALGHALHRFAAPGELAGLAVVVLACSAPFVATRLADALAERFDEGVVAPIRGSWERCLLTGAGALAAAYLPASLLAITLVAATYEFVALRHAVRAEYESRFLR